MEEFTSIALHAEIAEPMAADYGSEAGIIFGAG
jgi:hypothetical protein